MTTGERHPIPCIHCRYDVRGLSPDKPCPECGKPVSDTREGTLFYSLPPSRLASITIGTGLFGLALASWIVWALAQAVAGVLQLPLVFTVTGVITALCAYISHTWIPVFLLGTPLSGRSFWTLLRVAALASIAFSQLVFVSQQVDVLPAATGARVLNAAAHLGADAVTLLALIRLRRHGLLMPGRPHQSLAAGAITCWAAVLVGDVLRSSGLLGNMPIPNTIVTVLTPLFMLPGAIIALLQFRELRLITLDVDADHPCTRSEPAALRFDDAHPRCRAPPQPDPRGP